MNNKTYKLKTLSGRTIKYVISNECQQNILNKNYSVEIKNDKYIIAIILYFVIQNNYIEYIVYLLENYTTSHYFLNFIFNVIPDVEMKLHYLNILEDIITKNNYKDKIPQQLYIAGDSHDMFIIKKKNSIHNMINSFTDTKCIKKVLQIFGHTEKNLLSVRFNTIESELCIEIFNELLMINNPNESLCDLIFTKYPDLIQQLMKCGAEISSINGTMFTLENIPHETLREIINVHGTDILNIDFSFNNHYIGLYCSQHVNLLLTTSFFLKMKTNNDFIYMMLILSSDLSTLSKDVINILHQHDCINISLTECVENALSKTTKIEYKHVFLERNINIIKLIKEVNPEFSHEQIIQKIVFLIKNSKLASKNFTAYYLIDTMFDLLDINSQEYKFLDACKTNNIEIILEELTSETELKIKYLNNHIEKINSKQLTEYILKYPEYISNLNYFLNYITENLTCDEQLELFFNLNNKKDIPLTLKLLISKIFLQHQCDNKIKHDSFNSLSGNCILFNTIISLVNNNEITINGYHGQMDFFFPYFENCKVFTQQIKTKILIDDYNNNTARYPKRNYKFLIDYLSFLHLDETDP